MEKANFNQSQDTRKVNIFDEYATRPLGVLDSIDDLDENARANYKEIHLSNRNIFVRNDIHDEIQKGVDSSIAFDIKFGRKRESSLFQGVHKVLRPILKKTYNNRDKKDEMARTGERMNLLENIICHKEQEEKKRIEIAHFVASFPPNVQRSLKEGAFLIESEGRYYQTVEDGVDSFAAAELDSKFESRKAGTWRKGLFQTLVAGSSAVSSSLPSNISGVVNTFRAELKDHTVEVVVSGDSFSTFGNNSLSFKIKYEETGEEKVVTYQFQPF